MYSYIHVHVHVYTYNVSLYIHVGIYNLYSVSLYIVVAALHGYCNYSVGSIVISLYFRNVHVHVHCM